MRPAACALLVALSVAAAPQDDVMPGLIGEYFNIGEELGDFPAVAADKKPNVRKIDKTIEVESTEEGFNGTDLTEQFYVRWTGILRIAKEGKYTLFTESDDGSRVLIGGKLVVDNGGLHGMEEKSGEIELKAGDHEIKVEVFENGGGAGCKLSWEGAGQAKQIIPASVLFHKKDKDLDK